MDVLACGPEPMLEAVRASCRGRSSPGRRRWRVATEPATGASSRSTGGCSASASPGRCCARHERPASQRQRLPRRADRSRRRAQLDAFVTKTITPEPREGNPPVRIAETESGMLNSIGLQGPGIDMFLAETLPRLAAQRLRVWVSVGGFSASDYAGICERLDGRDDVDVVELNLSCPNVDEAPESAAEIVAACRGRTTKPLYAKLSPASSDIAESARAVVAAGADGLTLVNTLRGMALDPATLKPRLAAASVATRARHSSPSPLRASRPAPAPSMFPSSDWGACSPGRMRSSWSQRARALSRWARCCSPIRQHPLGSAKSCGTKSRHVDTAIRSTFAGLPTVDQRKSLQIGENGSP